MVKLYNLLFERATDQLYRKIVDYFKFLIKNKITSFTYSHISENEYPTFMAVFPRTLPASEYDEYKKLTGDDGQIIKDLNHWRKMIFDFAIFFHPQNKDPDASGSMTADGKFRIYIPEWNYEINEDNSNYDVDDMSYNFSTSLTTELSEQEKQEVKKLIKNYLESDEFDNILAHEIGHYINALRSQDSEGNPVNVRAKTRTSDPFNQFIIGTDEYKYSTEEIQARLIDFIVYIHRLVNKKLENNNRLSDNDKALLKALVTKNLNSFLELALQTNEMSPLPSFNDLFKDIEIKSRKRVAARVTQRLIEIFDQYKDMDKEIYKKFLEKQETEVL